MEIDYGGAVMMFRKKSPDSTSY